MNVGVLKLEVRLFSVSSLKEKRSIVKHLLNFVRKKYNVSAAEIGKMDSTMFMEVGVAMISNNRNIIHKTFESIIDYIEINEGLEIEGMEKEIW
ncbi:MAG: DUF503 domain-containing protein [Thermotogaceae bacterium]|nr:DUF503 domain-containing protein [Thermotogaceae bacterium]